MSAMDIGKLKDSTARELVRTELDVNFMLEAGAGSGKTSAMANRFVALIDTGRCSIDEIVAITFTRKAANELKERVRHELAKNGNSLATELHRCFIGTIHAFCSKLLRERPVEAGIDPEFVELDEGEDNSIREAIWEEYVLDPDDDRKAILERMDLFGLDQDVLKKFMKIVCANPDLEFALPDEKPFDLEGFEKIISKAFEEAKRLVQSAEASMPKPGATTENRRDALQNTIIAFTRKTSRPKDLSLTEKLAVLKDLNTASRIKVTQKCWGDTKEEKARAKEIGQEFEGFSANYTSGIFALRAEYGYNHVAVPFVREARQIYQNRKKAGGMLNFQDLLQGATELLRDDAGIRRYFQNKYKVILVDEFQDTDPVQSQMLMYLAGDDYQEKKWDKGVPLPGSLFVVGDPKQSIYGFRRADIDIYEKFKAILIETGGMMKPLTTNFRSVSELEKWFNGVFPELLKPKSQLAAQAGFSGMDTVADSLPGTLGGVFKYKIDAKTVPDVIASDSAHIERIIRYLTNGKEITAPCGGGGYAPRPIQYKDIMILYMKKAPLTSHAKALSEAGIPVKVVGADVVKRTPEFMNFADIIRMLAYPEENALLYKVLKGPSFGFSDEELFRFKEMGGHFNIYADIDKLKREVEIDGEGEGVITAHASDPELLQRIREAFALLRRFAYYTKKMVPAAAAERMIDELGMTARMLRSEYKLGEMGSFLSLVERIRMEPLANVWDLNQFIEKISLMIEAGYEEDIELEGENYNAVRMMNLHKAKGLEAPVVILAVPCSGAVYPPDFYVDRSREHEDGKLYGIATLKLSNRRSSSDSIKPAAWSDVQPIAEARAASERDRLLYVAATRARNMLIISDSAARGNPWEPLLIGSTGDDESSPAQVCDINRMIIEEGFDGTCVKTDKAADQDKAGIDLPAILARTRTALSEPVKSYEFYTPTEKHKRKEKDEIPEESGVDPDLILANSMEVHFEGDTEVLKTIRTDLGTAVHRVFEALIKGDGEIDTMIPYIVRQIDKPEITDKLLRDIADRFTASSLWKRIGASEAVYTEVPVSIKVPAGETYAGTVFGQDCYVSGSIDLVLQEDGGWTIVDYKTCAKTEVKDELSRLYKPQLDAYQEAWERATGEKVAKTEIFFVEKN